MSEYSQILFARPSFIEGVARVFDVANAMNIYNESKTDKDADIKAVASDWKAVGLDLTNALEQYEQESSISKQ